MSSFYMGLKVGNKNRRTLQDPRMLANEHKGVGFKSKVDKNTYVSIHNPIDLVKGKVK